MKYCIRYMSKFKYLDEIDEINIDFERTHGELPNFLENHKNQTINVGLVKEYTEKDVDLLIALYKKYGNIKIKLPMKDRESTEKIRKADVPFFFNDTIDDWDKLNEAISLEPTDVYIVNYLGFCLKDVAEMLHSRGMRVRVVPNLAQSRWRDQPGRRKFFIRPEDTAIYEPYVDVFELFAEAGRENVYYDIYAKTGYWYGNLNEIIYNLVEPIDSRRLIKQWGMSRLNCGKKCVKDKHCEICDRVILLAETLDKAEYELKQK